MKTLSFSKNKTVSAAAFSLTCPGLIFESKLLEKYSVMEQF